MLVLQGPRHDWLCGALKKHMLRDSICPWKRWSEGWGRPQGTAYVGTGGCTRRAPRAVVTKTEKYIFPHKNEAVYRLSKKHIPQSVQRCLMAPWEDFAACIWSCILCTSFCMALPSEPSFCMELILVFWDSTCVSSPAMLAISTIGNTTPCSKAVLMFFLVVYEKWIYAHHSVPWALLW